MNYSPTPDQTATFATASTAEEMIAFGAALGRILQPGDCVLLYGDLGAGKTTFSRGVVHGFTGIVQDVVSPTFTLVQSYARGDVSLYHYDLYRLDTADAGTLTELAWDDSLTYGVTLAEWPERLEPDTIPADALHIRITACPKGGRRLDYASACGKWPKRLEDVISALPPSTKHTPCQES